MNESLIIIASALANLSLHQAELYSSLTVATSEARMWRLSQEIKQTACLIKKLETLLA